MPPIPPKDPFVQQKQHWENRPALSQKSTNLKISIKDAKRAGKPTISSPVLQETTNASVSVPSRPTTSHTTQSAYAAQTSTADATDLSRKITNLLTQAAAQEEQTKVKANAYAGACAKLPPLEKLSPLERGKNAFVKATRAIKGRLSNSSNENAPSSKRPVAQRHSSFHELGRRGPPPQYESQEELSRLRLDRRIAEGENLSNPKIKSLTGDGNIPRKPLPVYETMRSRSMRSLPAKDPSSENQDIDSPQSPQDYSSFDFDFSKLKYNNNAPQTPSAAPNQNDGASETTGQHLAVPQSISRFSDMVSGLAQHSNTMLFSSPPIDHSTPQIRLEGQPNGGGDNQYRQVLTRSPSVMEFSFENESDNDSSKVAPRKGHEPRASDGSSLSIKRKGATDDLRSHLARSTKKAKTDSTISEDDLGLVARISDLDTGDERAPLSPKSVNIIDCETHRKANKRRERGMSIFDVGKGKELESREDKASAKPRARPTATKRTPVTRPSSMLFSRGRDSRNGMRRLSQNDDDSMDIDELQLDDAAYRVSGRKR